MGEGLVPPLPHHTIFLGVYANNTIITWIIHNIRKPGSDDMATYTIRYIEQNRTICIIFQTAIVWAMYQNQYLKLIEILFLVATYSKINSTHPFTTLVIVQVVLPCRLTLALGRGSDDMAYEYQYNYDNRTLNLLIAEWVLIQLNYTGHIL